MKATKKVLSLSFSLEFEFLAKVDLQYLCFLTSKLESNLIKLESNFFDPRNSIFWKLELLSNLVKLATC
jgi:hypothetical protein